MRTFVEAPSRTQRRHAPTHGRSGWLAEWGDTEALQLSVRAWWSPRTSRKTLSTTKPRERTDVLVGGAGRRSGPGVSWAG